MFESESSPVESRNWIILEKIIENTTNLFIIIEFNLKT